MSAPTLRIAYLALPNEVLAREWMAWFADAGHEVSLIVRQGAEIRPGLHPGIRVVPMRPYRGVVAGRLTAVDARRALRETLAELHPDVLHIHDLTTGYGWLARVSGFHPYVLTVWGSDLLRVAPSRWDAGLLTRLQMRGADLVTANARFLLDVSVHYWAKRERCTVVPFGVRTDRFHPAPPDPALRARLGLDGRRIAFAPRMIAPLYDQAAVVRAIPSLPDDVSVLMSAFNAIPATLAELEQLATDLGVRDRLVIVPGISREEMPAFVALADVVVTVPHTDGGASTVLEALAVGRPIVGSDVPAPREWLDRSWPEFIVPAGDAAAIADAVNRVLALPPDTLSARGAAARELVAEAAEQGASMRRMEALYRELAEARRRGGRAS
jgi:glycosyltransferase involved in cell wall biosynthesis